MKTLFINILRDHLQRRKTVISSVDWDELFRLSQCHQVTGIIYHQCKDIIPSEKASDFERIYAASLFYYANRVKAMNLISRLLADIPFFSVKGLEVAQYYPLPALRTMGDNDVVVEPGRLSEAVNVLKNHGFVQSPNPDESNEHVWSCEYKGMHFEFHDRLTEKDARTSEQQSFFGNFMPYVKENRLDWNYHFVFLLMHLRKHFMNSGVGLRQFMDIAIVAKGREDLDWDWIEAKLRELKLDKFAHSCYSLIDDWFGIKAPVQFERIDAELTEEIAEKILNNGVFGFNNEENRDNRISNVLILSGDRILKNRITFFIGKIFPDYEYMKGYPSCGFLDGKPYLLPIAWIRRFIYILGKHDHIDRSRTITGTFKSTSELEKRKAMLEQMGILEGQNSHSGNGDSD